MRVGIVGAGLMGAVTAYHLAAQGAEVIVFDSHNPGDGTSGASFAWTNASTPEIRDRDYFDLCQAALDEVTTLAHEVGADHWFQPSGHLRWAVQDSDSEKELLAHADKLAGWGYDVQIRDAADVSTCLEPTIAFEAPSQPVVVFPRESWIDAPQLIRRLLSSATARGVRTIIGKAVTRVETTNSCITHVVLDDGASYDIDVLVNAAGPSAGHIASLVGRDLPMLSSPGLVARLRGRNFRTTLAMHSPHVEIRPDGDCQILLHSREIDARLDSSGFAGDQHINDLRDLATAVIPELADSHLVDARVGWRPIPGDTLPSVGTINTIGGYYEVVSHLGATLAPLLGRLAATEIGLGQTSSELARYRPERLALTGAQASDSSSCPTVT